MADGRLASFSVCVVCIAAHLWLRSCPLRPHVVRTQNAQPPTTPRTNILCLRLLSCSKLSQTVFSQEFALLCRRKRNMPHNTGIVNALIRVAVQPPNIAIHLTVTVNTCRKVHIRQQAPPHHSVLIIFEVRSCSVHTPQPTQTEVDADRSL